MKTLARAVGLVVVSLACSPPDVASSNAQAACADYAYAYCTRLQQCSETALHFRYPNEPTCESSVSTWCVASATAQATAATPSFFEGCAQAISATWACGDFLDDKNPPPACKPPTGSVPSGGACAFNGQCTTGFCAIVPGAACGTCAPQPNPGDSCAALTSCGRGGLTCENGVCLAFAELGEPCGTPASGAHCAAGFGCSNGTCQQPTEKAGAACGGSDGLQCDTTGGLSCNTLTLLCDPVELVGAGAACGLVGNQEAYCSGGSLCVGGTCSGAAGLGEPCDLAQGPFCIGFSRCMVTSDAGTGGTCAVGNASTCP